MHTAFVGLKKYRRNSNKKREGKELSTTFKKIYH
jgi:hypothetical protein